MNMRMLIALISIGTLFLANCGQQATEPDSTSIFSQPYPADGATDIPTTAELTWHSALGPESGATYEVFISTKPGPEDSAETKGEPPFITLPGRTYHWHVRAHLPNGRTYSSPMWHFRTAVHYQYPLELNTGWRYRVRFYFTDIETFGTGKVPTDTTEYATYVIVAGLDDILGSPKSAFKLVETIHYSEGQPSSDTAIGWFNNESDGFYEYGYEVGSFGLSLPRKLTADHDWYIDPALAQFFHTPAIATPGISASSAEPIWETFRSLAYPLRVGLAWDPSDRSEVLNVTKRVTSRSKVEAGGSDYLCWTVRWFYEGIDNLSVIDQIGDPGLVSRTTIATGVRLTSPDYPEGFARATVHQEIELDYRFILRDVPFEPGGIIIIDGE